MSNRPALETAAKASASDRGNSSSFYLVEVRRTPGAAGYRTAARAVEDLETRRFPTLAELCRFLESAMEAVDGPPGDRGPAHASLGSRV